MIGQTIGHYQIIEKLGEGGMGVVYKATDANLNRPVALKFLPDRVSQAGDAKARFLQEAQAAAGLNHPNICTIYGVEDVDGSLFIAMEYVDGGTLRDKLPFDSVDDTLRIASQIADALQEAHAKGIVHRDVKADNIMLSAKGQAKVMDFGLAKLKGALKLTRTSSTVGTLGYMAPEQIQGGEVDHRSDIFSFGVLLFEMLTGKLPFRGEHEAAMVYSIVNEEPQDITTLLPDISPVIGNLIQRCLEKDPSERYQHFDDITADLKRAQRKTSRVMKSSPYIAASNTHPTGPTIADRDKRMTGLSDRVGVISKKRWPAIGGAGLALFAFALYWILSGPSERSGGTSVRAQFAQVTQLSGMEAEPDFSPDGSFVTYTKFLTEMSHIYLQRVGGGDPIDLTKDSKSYNRSPIFSPDGQTIAFWSLRDGGGIYLMGATGESIRRFTDFGYHPSWSPDGDRIVVSTAGFGDPGGRGALSELVSIVIATGRRDTLHRGDAIQPSWSPNGLRVAYWGLGTGGGRTGGSSQRDIWTIPATGGDPVPITQDAYVDWSPVWSPDGKYLYFASDRGGSQNLWRVPINEESGETLGDPEPITTPSKWSGYLSISSDGKKIAYSAFEFQSNVSKVAFDPVGNRFIGAPIPVTKGTRRIEYFDISSSGEWLAFSTSAPQFDIFIIKSDGSGQRQLTDDPAKDRTVSISPDGKRIAFQSDRSGRWDAWAINVDGSGLERLTATTGGPLLRPQWFPDGRRVLTYTSYTSHIVDLNLPLASRIPARMEDVDSPGVSFWGVSISPDGKRIAGYRRKGENREKDIPGLTIYSFETNSYRTITDSADFVRWFQDGKRVMYKRGSEFHVVNAESGISSPAQSNDAIPDFSQYLFSPDNRFVYFIQNDNEADIWVATLQE